MEAQQKQASRQEQLSKDILNTLLGYSNYRQEDIHIDQLSAVHLNKIRDAIENHEPIEFVLPAFPAKSSNRLKTLSSTPDLGEVEALKRLNHLADKIKSMYAPGAVVVICSDGRVFSDLVGVTENDVSLYGRELRLIRDRFSLKNIDFFDLEDVYQDISFDDMRARLEERHGVSVAQLKEQVASDDDARNMFNGIHKFIKEDYLFQKDMSKNQVQKLAKEVAYKVIIRSNAWSSLVESLYPKAFRFSIHPQLLHSRKFPIRLLNSDERWGTPWHRVPVIKDGVFQLMRHQDASRSRGTNQNF